MKVVLFCGGAGMRIREYPQPVPKPMITIGYRPILWHLMKYYAHYGHKDFILCLGYKADVVKDYFLNYSECLTNDFILSNGGKNLKLLNTDIGDWNITFVDTGMQANIGERLKAVQPHLEGEGAFLANYSDGLTNLNMVDYVDRFLVGNSVGSFLAVNPPYTTHLAVIDDEIVTDVRPISRAGLWINGGFFVFRSEIFDYMRAGEELVLEPFQRLIKAGKLTAHKYDGYWGCMDTFKEKQHLEDLYNRGDAPWEVWKSASNGTAVEHLSAARNGSSNSEAVVSNA